MNKNLALTITAATLFIVIGIMVAWWFNGGNIDSVKPYVDPYKNYTEAELTVTTQHPYKKLLVNKP